jgi:CDP-diacylglycerol pyrophosphatase
MRINHLADFGRKLLRAAIVASLVAPTPASAFSGNERGALWQVVDKLCLPMHRTLGLALPCLAVEPSRGYVVVRAPGDTTRIIVVPTVRMTGLESPALLKSDAPNYWAFAWGERNRVAAAAGRPLGWGDLGMAINSKPGRTQDQMHIHVDCVDARLKRALADAGARLSTKNWVDLELKPWAGRYRAKRLPETGLEQNVFQMVAQDMRARAQMGMRTIAVVGSVDAKGERGFVVLEKGGGGSAERLLDHRCRAER